MKSWRWHGHGLKIQLARISYDSYEDGSSQSHTFT